MDKIQKHQLVKDFILDYLPEVDNKRKYVNNEIDNVTRAINSFMQKHFGFKVEKIELLQIFDSLSFNIYRKRIGYNSDTKRLTSSKESELWSGKEEDMLGHFIYVQISASTVSRLYRSMRTMPAGTNPEKLRDLELFRNELSSFIEFHKGFM